MIIDTSEIQIKLQELNEKIKGKLFITDELANEKNATYSKSYIESDYLLNDEEETEFIKINKYNKIYVLI